MYKTNYITHFFHGNRSYGYYRLTRRLPKIRKVLIFEIIYASFIYYYYYLLLFIIIILFMTNKNIIYYYYIEQ